MATKHDQILKHIEELPIGDRISVRSIAKSLSVSEGTAYRAIKDAENIGLVSTIQRVGTIRIERKLKKHIEKLTFGEVVRIIEGDVLGGSSGLDKVLNKFVIGAMTETAMTRYITPGSLMIVGNRQGVQKLALENDVDLLAVDKTELDIVNSSKVAQIFDSFKPDVVINAAAYTAVDKAETEKEIAYAVNCIGPKNLAEAAEKYNALMVHISTDYVFSGDKSGIYHEDDITGPATVYGKTKLDGENAVVQACRKHIIIRTAWVFGEHGNNFVKTMLRIAQSRSQLGIVADQVGGPTYAGDIADALIKIIQNIINDNNEKFGIYHFSGLPHVSWSEFAEEIFDAASKEGVIKIKPIINPISTLDYPTPARRPVNSRLDTQRITRCFGIEASNWKKALHSIKAYKS